MLLAYHPAEMLRTALITEIESMMTNYKTGVRLEYLVVNTLKEHLPKNCTVHRTAGSHTGADVIVIQKRRAIKIQCKSKKVKGKKC